MAIVQAVEVQTLTGLTLVRIDAEDVLGPFAVHEAIGHRGGWTVTHVESALAAADGLPDRSAAIAAAKALERAADWSKATSSGFPPGSLSQRARQRLARLRRTWSATG